MLYIGSRPISMWFDSGATSSISPGSYLEGSPLDRSLFMVLIVIGLLILFQRKLQWSVFLKSNKWVFLFFLYSLISTQWSDYPFVSFKRWFKDMGNLVMVLIILSDNDPLEALKTIFRRLTYTLIPLSIVFNKYFSEIGRSYSPITGRPFYQGVADGKNGIGILCLVCGFYFLWNLYTNFRKSNVTINKHEAFLHVLFLAMIFWVLKMADSATPLVCLVLGSLTVLGLGLPIIKNNLKNIGAFVFITAFLTIILQWVFNIWQSLISSLGRDLTLTGRTEIWEAVLKIDINPLLGAGYKGFWSGERLATLWDTLGVQLIQAHNGYIETYLNLGLIGLILLAMVIGSGYKNAKRELTAYNFNYGRFRMAILVMTLAYNITEATLSGPQVLWFVFLLTVAVEYPCNREIS